MKLSIAVKIFLVAMALFLFALLLQWLAMNQFFDTLYLRSIRTTMQNELHAAVQKYWMNNEERQNTFLTQYTMDTGSPVMVITEDYAIADSDILYRMQIIRAQTDDGELIHIPLDYLSTLSNDPSDTLVAGTDLQTKLVRLGSSDYYEPLTITVDNVSYSNRTSMREYTVVKPDTKKYLIPLTVVLHRNNKLSNNTQSIRAGIIYDHVKDCLITRKDISVYLEDLCRQPIQSGSDTYQFLYDTKTIDGLSYYFITAQNVVITGFEAAYVNRYFMTAYLAFGFILVIAAIALAQLLSKPLRELNSVTEKLADLDFSQRTDYQSGDEMGQLSNHINTMADRLERSMIQLRASSDNAVQNEKRMKRLLADLAHEFKTPLGLIGGFADVLKTGINEREPDYYIDIILDEVSGLTDLVNEAIELTKLQSGHWQINLSECNIKKLITGTLNKFSKHLESNGFSVHIDVQDCLVTADAVRIEQVISNFMSNAIKYADDKKLITISTAVDDGFLNVTIGNSGTIQDEILNKIWEREYSSKTESHTRLPSQGIGLDIAKSILNAHNSRIHVEQAEGMVYFRFSLAVV